MLNLNKSEGVVLNLKKDQGIEGQMAEIEFVGDCSGSTEPLYRVGSYRNEPGKSAMDRAVERILPVGMAFSTSKSVRVRKFGSNAQTVAELLTEQNLDGFVRRNLNHNMGSTYYSNVINLIAQDYRTKYGYTKENRIIAVEEEVPSTSFWGQLFGAKKTSIKEKRFYIDVKETPADGPLLVIFYTDGDNDDQSATIRALQDCAGLPIFWQFVGLKDTGSDFKNLKELDEMDGRYIDNANFFEMRLDELNSISDEEIYSRILNEFGRKYIPLAKSDKYKLIK